MMMCDICGRILINDYERENGLCLDCIEELNLIEDELEIDEGVDFEDDEDYSL